MMADPARQYPAQEARRYYVSVDLGQMSDYTAITATEAVGIRNWPDPKVRRAFNVRMIERFQLGTPYKAVVARVAAIMRSPQLVLPGYAPPCLVVDQTGVGRPVVEHMRSEGLAPVGITITGGATVSRPEPLLYPFDVHVPKSELVGAVQVVLGNDALRVAPCFLAPILKQEFSNFKIKISQAGNAQFEAWRTGDHDDIILSLACGLWVALHGRKYGLGLPPSKTRPVLPVASRRS